MKEGCVNNLVSKFEHCSVLLNESIDLLQVRENGIYIDGTAGGGGHSAEILKRLNLSGKLICFDKDPDAVEVLNNRFKNNTNVLILKSDFKNIPIELNRLKIKKVDGILLDLGVSSYQLDNSERGFSYSKNGFLDMRMSKNGISAYDVVNNYSLNDLSKIFFEYGEEKFSKQIAKNIENVRAKRAIETTYELCEIIKASIPSAARRKGGNPCKRVFQALRIAVNNELESLSQCIDESFRMLNVSGRFCIITFHSLEDRIVKQKFLNLAKSCVCPPGFPICICGHRQFGKIISKKPILPSAKEMVENSRSKSAKLRVIEKIADND